MFQSPARPPYFKGLPKGKVLVRSTYGPRIHPILGSWQNHNGVDLGVPQGTTLLAPGAGTVVKRWDNDSVNGGGVLIQHANGYRTAAIHMSRVDVVVGQSVTASTVIGLSGGALGTYGAGRSTGAHVHYMIYAPGGATVDPLPLTSFGGLTVASTSGDVLAVAREAAEAAAALPLWVPAAVAVMSLLLVAVAFRRRTATA